MSELEKHRLHLEKLDHLQVELAKALMKADKGNIYSLDFVFLAALNRSRCNISAFSSLILEKNYLAGAPFIRMQLDSVLRLYALRLVDQPNSLAGEILKGEPLNKKKARTGEKMTDAYLCTALAKHEPWIESVYKSGSGFIHLSEKHIFSLFTDTQQERTFEMAIGATQSHIPNELRVEAFAAMAHITELLIGLCKKWALEKHERHNTPPSPQAT